jgi:hypothetical protein
VSGRRRVGAQTHGHEDRDAKYYDGKRREVRTDGDAP